MTWEEKVRAIIDQHHQLKLGTRNALVLEFADALRSAYERGIGDAAKVVDQAGALAKRISGRLRSAEKTSKSMELADETSARRYDIEADEMRDLAARIRSLATDQGRGE